MTTLPIDIPLHLLSDNARPHGRVVERAQWSETLPACFRSEAFAEDLAEPAEPAELPLRAAGPARHNAAGCNTPPSFWLSWSRRRLA